MIKSYRDKRLKSLMVKGDWKGLPPDLVKKIKIRLERIDTARDIGDIGVRDLHELKGDREGTWAVKISGNWRVTFEFIDGDAYDVNLEDYH
ncbi:MAG: Killer protein [Oscillatoriales cyanobacterium SM2_1_8]|nr:Killer protein [Oscillatoriales cyanobacterium SM2_1_8]